MAVPEQHWHVVDGEMAELTLALITLFSSTELEVNSLPPAAAHDVFLTRTSVSCSVSFSFNIPNVS